MNDRAEERPTFEQEISGCWYCQTVDQEQSEDEQEFGEYDDFGREPQRASKTEHAQTMIEFRADGTYRLTGADEYMASKGTWTFDGRQLNVSEVEPAGGYDGLEYSMFEGTSLTLAYKLVPDAHDGLDILVLNFTREPPKVRGPKPQGLVECLAQAEDEDEMWEALDEALDEQQRDPAEVTREIWDGVVAGRLLTDPESDAFHDLLSVIADERLSESGGFNHQHALALLPKVGPRDALGDLLAELLALLPEDARDEQLAAHMNEAWIAEFARSRFVGGGAPEALFLRPVFPQPAMDDASRAYALKTYYTRFDSIARLFPPGHPDAARVALHYRGSGLLEVPVAFLKERGRQKDALDAALDTLGREEVRDTGLRQSALIFSIVLSLELGQAIPQTVFDECAAERTGMMLGSLSAQERATLKGLIAELPEAHRELVTKTLYLDKDSE